VQRRSSDDLTMNASFVKLCKEPSQEEIKRGFANRRQFVLNLNSVKTRLA